MEERGEKDSVHVCTVVRYCTLHSTYGVRVHLFIRLSCIAFIIPGFVPRPLWLSG